VLYLDCLKGAHRTIIIWLLIAFAIKGHLDQAIADYNKVLEADPEFSFVYVERGLAYEKTGQYDRAIDDFSKALNFNPSDASCYYHIMFRIPNVSSMAPQNAETIVAL
jgi:tetratricopeptide (TPR) repeat protein